MEIYRLKLFDYEKNTNHSCIEIELKPLKLLKNKLGEFHQDIPYKKLSIP